MRSEDGIGPHGLLESKGLLDRPLNQIALLARVGEHAVEIVDLVAWRFALDFTVEESANIFVVEHLVLNRDNGAAHLPVGLAIQLVRPNIGGARLVSRIEADHVGGYAFIRIDEDNVADPNILCHLRADDTRVAIQSFVLLLIEQLVPLPSLIVLIILLYNRDGQHEDQRRQIRNQEADTERLEELRNTN